MSNQRYHEKMFAAFLMIVSIFGLSTHSEAQNWNKKLKNEPIYYDFNSWRNYRVEPSNSPRELQKSLIPNEFAVDQIKNTGLINFMVYENGVITQDYKASEGDRNAIVGPGVMSDETRLLSNSMGKSIVSFLIGHAICEGVIPNVDATISDWPLVANTVYENAKIVELLNMSTGDHNLITKHKGSNDDVVRGNRTSRLSTITIESLMRSDWFHDTKPSTSRRYNYSNLTTRILLNYLIFKLDSDYESFLSRIFQENVGNEHAVYMLKTYALPKEGAGRYTTYMTRYDYLRFALNLMETWDKDTCMGRYLTEIYQRRVDKNQTPSRHRGRSTQAYGGQFHFDYVGYSGQRIVGLDGYGGQSILIDLDRKKIVIAHAMQADYDWHKLVLREIGR
jgi:CubicO group peptidase (beta-lactamase class C family)